MLFSPRPESPSSTQTPPRVQQTVRPSLRPCPRVSSRVGGSPCGRLPGRVGRARRRTLGSRTFRRLGSRAIRGFSLDGNQRRRIGEAVRNPRSRRTRKAIQPGVRMSMCTETPRFASCPSRIAGSVGRSWVCHRRRCVSVWSAAADALIILRYFHLSARFAKKVFVCCTPENAIDSRCYDASRDSVVIEN
jgi:hypothetical protein